MVETNLMPVKDEERWTLVTRRRPRNPKQAQTPPLRQRKRQNKTKNPQCVKGKKNAKTSKRQEI